MAAGLGENPISAPEARRLATRDELDGVALHRVQPLTARLDPGSEPVFPIETKRGTQLRHAICLDAGEPLLVSGPSRMRDTRALATANALTPRDAREWDADRQWAMVHGHAAGTPLQADEVDRLEALYRGEIEYIDHAFADLLTYIDDEKVGQNTVVVVFSDHGDEFSRTGQIGHGFSLTNEVLQVPLFFRWPEHIEAGADSGPAEIIDILPTLLELSGIESPPSLDGASLQARIRGRRRESLYPAAPTMPTGRRSTRRRGADSKLWATWNSGKVNRQVAARPSDRPGSESRVRLPLQIQARQST